MPKPRCTSSLWTWKYIHPDLETWRDPADEEITFIHMWHKTQWAPVSERKFESVHLNRTVVCGGERPTHIWISDKAVLRVSPWTWIRQYQNLALWFRESILLLIEMTNVQPQRFFWNCIRVKFESSLMNGHCELGNYCRNVEFVQNLLEYLGVWRNYSSRGRATVRNAKIHSHA